MLQEDPFLVVQNSWQQSRKRSAIANNGNYIPGSLSPIQKQSKPQELLRNFSS